MRESTALRSIFHVCPCRFIAVWSHAPDITDLEARADDFLNYKRVEPGDLVINRMRAFEGGAGLSMHRGMVSSDYAVLRTTDVLDARFFHHLIRSRWFVGEMSRAFAGSATRH
jgi:type I restriction enzyme S subunit